MSRVKKFGSSSGKAYGQDTANEPSGSGIDSKDDAAALPPRRKKYPSSAQKLTKWYYNLIIVLFLGLVAALFFYGVKYTE